MSRFTRIAKLYESKSENRHSFSKNSKLTEAKGISNPDIYIASEKGDINQPCINYEYACDVDKLKDLYELMKDEQGWSEVSFQDFQSKHVLPAKKLPPSGYKYESGSGEDYLTHNFDYILKCDDRTYLFNLDKLNINGIYSVLSMTEDMELTSYDGEKIDKYTYMDYSGKESLSKRILNLRK